MWELKHARSFRELVVYRRGRRVALGVARSHRLSAEGRIHRSLGQAQRRPRIETKFIPSFGRRPYSNSRRTVDVIMAFGQERAGFDAFLGRCPRLR